MGQDRRELKRARQACLNCRRKKARCSGEKPVCAFCARLKQTCEWDNPASEIVHRPSVQRTTSGGRDAAGLAARVALLEAKLGLLNDKDKNPYIERTPNTSSIGELTYPKLPARKRPLPRELGTDESSYEGDYSSVPTGDTFRHLIDVYFEHIHNQPYAFFHEATFRRKWEEGQLPDYLILAFAATAVKYSTHPTFRGRQDEALAAYANASWLLIFEHAFSYNENLEFPMVQASALLSIIDFGLGHGKLGWVKFSLTLRFAQGLRLNEEPDESLSGTEQEERRRAFWSIFILDAIISVGPSRPPSISYPDCTLRLPCQEDLFCNGLASDSEPTLEALIEDPTAPCHQDLDYFAMAVLVASALRRFVRFAMRDTARDKYMMWDPRSQYHLVNSDLLHFEALSPCALGTINETIQHQFTFDGHVDKQRAGHFLYSHGLFHLVHCLLNHPFILYHVLQPGTTPVPPSFVEEALLRCRKHAAELLAMLQYGQEHGLLVASGFYGYCAVTTAIIHRLYQSHDDPAIASVSQARAEASLQFFAMDPVRWPIFRYMKASLQTFKPGVEISKVVISPVGLVSKFAVPNGDTLWHMVSCGKTPEPDPESPEDPEIVPAMLQEVIDQSESAALDDCMGFFPTHPAGSEAVYAREGFVGESLAGDVWQPDLQVGGPRPHMPVPP